MNADETERCKRCKTCKRMWNEITCEKVVNKKLIHSKILSGYLTTSNESAGFLTPVQCKDNVENTKQRGHNSRCLVLTIIKHSLADIIERHYFKTHLSMWFPLSLSFGSYFCIFVCDSSTLLVSYFSQSTWRPCLSLLQPERRTMNGL